ncbi:MAG TPA: SIMPL domain-containing protein [Gaiellaceae bacterium]|jgi:hypothetical protein
MTRLRYVLLISGVLLVAAAIAGVALPSKGGAATSAGTTITVTGNGTANATPDKASFDFGVHSTASTATDALNEDNTQAQKIIDGLKNAGIPESDIQTTEVSLYPESHKGQITGYRASNSVNVTSGFKEAGNLVDAAVGAGANNVDGPNLSVSDQKSQYETALKLAVADAKAQAQAIAEGAGLTLGDVQHISNNGSGPEPYYRSYAFAAEAAAPTTIEAGTQQIQASVTVTYSAS